MVFAEARRFQLRAHHAVKNASSDTLTAALVRASRVVVFTGAGVSTDSGIPDYRGSGGQYSRYQPVYFDEFLQSPDKRVEYWTHKAGVWPAMRAAEPGPAHQLVRAIADRGALQGVITQNIDGLHEKSGVASEFIVNLHGTNLEVECLGCRRRRDAASVLDPLAETLAARELTEEDLPRCDTCGELLKPATVMFGQSLSGGELARAEVMLAGCDLLLAMGSTLTVQPAASIPVIARNNGARLAIVTRGETPIDHLADYRIDGDLASFAARARDALADR